jgi:hypothetical protein
VQELRIVSWTTTGAASPDVSSPASTARQSPRDFTDAGVDASGTGCINTCAVDLPTIYVDTVAVESLQVVSARGHGSCSGQTTNRSFAKSSIAAMLITATLLSGSSMQRVDNALWVLTNCRHRDSMNPGILSQQEYDQKRKGDRFSPKVMVTFLSPYLRNFMTCYSYNPGYNLCLPLWPFSMADPHLPMLVLHYNSIKFHNLVCASHVTCRSKSTVMLQTKCQVLSMLELTRDSRRLGVPERPNGYIVLLSALCSSTELLAKIYQVASSVRLTKILWCQDLTALSLRCRSTLGVPRQGKEECDLSLTQPRGTTHLQFMPQQAFGPELRQTATWRGTGFRHEKLDTIRGLFPHARFRWIMLLTSNLLQAN